MPNRVIREGILTSERVNRIASDPQCEVFYRRLFGVVDDFGHFPSHPLILRAALYPLMIDAVSENDVGRYVDACRAAGLLITYEVRGKQHLEICDFNQRLRRMSNRYPPPSDVSGSDSDFRPPESETESESESETETEDETETCASSDARVCDSSPSSKRKPPVSGASVEQQGWFVRWWDAFWSKKDRLRALDAFVRLVRTQVQFDRVMAATLEQSAELLAKEPRHRPYPANWLERERFLDEAEPSHALIRIPGWSEGKDLR
jgi:hypothetical protein